MNLLGLGSFFAQFFKFRLQFLDFGFQVFLLLFQNLVDRAQGAGCPPLACRSPRPAGRLPPLWIRGPANESCWMEYGPYTYAFITQNGVSCKGLRLYFCGQGVKRQVYSGLIRLHQPASGTLADMPLAGFLRAVFVFIA